MKTLKNNAFVGNTSTLVNEIDLLGSERLVKPPEWSACFFELTDPFSVKLVPLDDLASRGVLSSCAGVGVVRQAYHLAQILRAQATHSISFARLSHHCEHCGNAILTEQKTVERYFAYVHSENGLRL